MSDIAGRHNIRRPERASGIRELDRQLPFFFLATAEWPGCGRSERFDDVVGIADDHIRGRNLPAATTSSREVRHRRNSDHIIKE
jgi:hypothetical protein